MTDDRVRQLWMDTFSEAQGSREGSYAHVLRFTALIREECASQKTCQWTLFSDPYASEPTHGTECDYVNAEQQGEYCPFCGGKIVTRS